MNDFYVYAHYKKGEENIPFYIGKGRKKRAYEKFRRSQFWRNVVNKYGFEVRILCNNLNEFEAFWLEEKLIGMFGRADLGNGPLVNMTNGGDGASGQIQTEENRKKKSDALRGRKYDESRRNNIAKGMKGNKNANGPMSDERKEKISISQRGSKNHRFGIKLTEEEKYHKSITSPNQKTYEVEYKGMVFLITGLNEFCKTNKLDIRCVHRAITENRKYKEYKITRL